MGRDGISVDKLGPTSLSTYESPPMEEEDPFGDPMWISGFRSGRDRSGYGRDQIMKGFELGFGVVEGVGFSWVLWLGRGWDRS